MTHTTYELLDSGFGQKFERFGAYTFVRPCSQAVFFPKLDEACWNKADALFTREGYSQWLKPIDQTKPWIIEVESIKFILKPTDFGHLGIFPEQRPFWKWLQETCKKGDSILNLFAYSGGATLAAAKGGASVCHLDASHGMVNWARENASVNQLDDAPIRWIVDDVMKFLKREIKRGASYDGILLDPPSFGRGKKGEVFKIESDVIELLSLCKELLSDSPKFLLFSCHTPGFSPLINHHLVQQTMKEFNGVIDYGEMCLTGHDGVLPLPSGTFARWRA
jgi:23S rRNA (cytosine1962-C5)-methyltransferase